MVGDFRVFGHNNNAAPDQTEKFNLADPSMPVPIFPAENDTITNTSSVFEFREMQVKNIDVRKVAQNRPYFVSLTTQLNPGKKAFISIVGTSSNFLPF